MTDLKATLRQCKSCRTYKVLYISGRSKNHLREFYLHRTGGPPQHKDGFDIICKKCRKSWYKGERDLRQTLKEHTISSPPSEGQVVNLWK
tara:strand:- start:2566 stop:2835 length:270 start_codon:yes stop_codon:yes gene_type:complete